MKKSNDNINTQQPRRLVECEKCGAKYAFIIPTKPGVYRIECPRCKEEIKFKVLTNN